MASHEIDGDLIQKFFKVVEAVKRLGHNDKCFSQGTSQLSCMTSSWEECGLSPNRVAGGCVAELRQIGLVQDVA